MTVNLTFWNILTRMFHLINKCAGLGCGGIYVYPLVIPARNLIGLMDWGVGWCCVCIWLFQKSCAPPHRGTWSSRLFFTFLCLEFRIFFFFFPSFIPFLYVLFSFFFLRNSGQIIERCSSICPISLLFLEFQ